MNKVLFKVEVPDYIRTITISDRQRPSYYYYDTDKKTIKAKSKPLLKKYINKHFYNHIAELNKIKPYCLKFPYVIAAIQAEKIIGYYGFYKWVDLDYELTEVEYLINTTSLNKQIFVLSDGFHPTDATLTTKQREKPIKLLLIDIITKEKVIANTTQVGKPKVVIIKGNNIVYNIYPEYVRAKIFTKIKEQFVEYLDHSIRLKPEDFPIGIKMEIHDTVKDKFDKSKEEPGNRWDVGNRGLPYLKPFIDLLVKSEIIPDDDRLHVQGESVKFIPINNNKDNKLVFKIIKL